MQANLALDEALLIEADEGRGGAVLRAWEQDAFAVVLGASRRIDRDVDLEACRADGVPVARRSSGGGTVVIGPGALNLTVVLPSGYAPGLNAVDTAQRFVLDRTAAALRDAGIPAEVLGSGDLARGGTTCHSNESPVISASRLIPWGDRMKKSSTPASQSGRCGVRRRSCRRLVCRRNAGDSGPDPWEETTRPGGAAIAAQRPVGP